MVYDELPLLMGIFCGKERSESEGKEKERGGVGRGDYKR